MVEDLEKMKRKEDPLSNDVCIKNTMSPEITETIQSYESEMEAYILRWSEMIPQIEKIIRKFLRALPGRRIVDVGCGAGRDTIYYLDHGYDVIGIDLSSAILKEAIGRARSAGFFRMDMRYLGFRDETFDGIHCWASLQHIPKRYLTKVLAGFHKILKPEGRLLIHTRYGKGETFIPSQGLHRRFFALYDEQELLSIIRRHGFAPLSHSIVRKVRFEPEVKMLNLISRRV